MELPVVPGPDLSGGEGWSSLRLEHMMITDQGMRGMAKLSDRPLAAELIDRLRSAKVGKSFLPAIALALAVETIPSSLAAGELGTRPASTALSGDFRCPAHSISISLVQANGKVSLGRLALDGKAASPKVRSQMKAALRGFTLVSGLSVRCRQPSGEVTLMMSGHAESAAAQSFNGLGEEDDVASEFIVSGREFTRITPIALD